MYTRFKIPNTVITIGASAFAYCSKMESINIPDSVEKIDVAVFDGCKSLTSINIPENVTSIVRGAFRACTNLTTVTIDSSAIASGLTSQTSSGYLINYATTVYVKSGITPGSYITDTTNFTEAPSDKEGYLMYTKN